MELVKNLTQNPGTISLPAIENRIILPKIFLDDILRDNKSGKAYTIRFSDYERKLFAFMPERVYLYLGESDKYAHEFSEEEFLNPEIQVLSRMNRTILIPDYMSKKVFLEPNEMGFYVVYIPEDYRNFGNFFEDFAYLFEENKK